MNQSHSEKEIAELLKIKAETRLLKINSYFDIIKSIALIIGAIILFLIIKRPESIINQKASEETINRERAKLVIDLLKEEDPQKILLGISVIKASYPASDLSWINTIEHTYEEKSNYKLIRDLNKHYEQLLDDRNKYRDMLLREMSGTGASGHRGQGPVARQINYFIERLTIEMDSTETQLKRLRPYSNFINTQGKSDVPFK